MSKVALQFPGQGSQAVGMGAHLVDLFPQVRGYFEQASKILGWDLLQVCREGPEEKLRRTEVAQPALYVIGFATSAALETFGVRPSIVAGHSIGEYAALAAARVFSFAEGLLLVQERARLMREAAEAHPGSMMAILGLSPEQVEELCREAQTHGVCAAVNFNGLEQTVIAGDSAGLEAAARLANAQGAKRVIPLNVSGAFHSPLMAEAALGMRARLEKVTFKKAVVPVVMNADGQVHEEPEDIRRQLTLQLDHPVRWAQTLQTLKAQGVGIFVECGTGKVLSGLLRRMDRQATAYDTDTIEAIQQVGEVLGAARKE